MKYGIVIVAWNAASHLRECLSSVVAQVAPPTVVVVIDNASDDHSVDVVESFKESLGRAGASLVLVREAINTGFTRAANRGLDNLLGSHGAVDFAVLLNQDATLEPGCAVGAARLFQDDGRIGVVGAKIFQPNGFTIQHAGGFIERPRMIGRHYGHHQPDQNVELQQPREVEFVTAAAMAVRLTALSEVGVFDEIFSPGYYEDVDLCDRMRAQSWKVIYSPALVARHAESISFAKRDDLRGLAHRNRLFYALRFLANPDTRKDFARSERAYLRSRPPLDDQRALGLGYLSAMLGLRQALDARLLPEARSTELTEALIELFAELRRDLLEEGQRCAPIRVARPG